MNAWGGKWEADFLEEVKQEKVIILGVSGQGIQIFSPCIMSYFVGMSYFHQPFKLLYSDLCIMDVSSFFLSSIIPPPPHRLLRLLGLVSFLPLHTVLVRLLSRVPTHPRSRLAHGPSSASWMLSSKNWKVETNGMRTDNGCSWFMEQLEVLWRSCQSGDSSVCSRLTLVLFSSRQISLNSMN